MVSNWLVVCASLIRITAKWNTTGLVGKQHTLHSSWVQQYTYNGLLRVTDVVDDRGLDQYYGYDLAGNRTSVKIDSVTPTTSAYNNANQANSWQYDAAGNLKNDGTLRYSYDALNG